jgi:protein-tyrosine-phosphatase
MPKIMMVCTANICRSPLAAAILQQKLQEAGYTDWEVTSAGTWAEWKRGASTNSVVVASQYGLDIKDHQATMISAENLAEVDLALCMTAHHYEALRAEFRAEAFKIFMLSQMVERRYDIGDPYGQSLPAYERMGTEVKNVIDEGFERIVALAEANAARRSQ